MNKNSILKNAIRFGIIKENKEFMPGTVREHAPKYLYHFTTKEGLENILKERFVRKGYSSVPTGIGGLSWGISLTAQDDFNLYNKYRPLNYRLKFDVDKMWESKYKPVPRGYSYPEKYKDIKQSKHWNQVPYREGEWKNRHEEYIIHQDKMPLFPYCIEIIDIDGKSYL